MKQVLTALLALHVVLFAATAGAQFRTIPKEARRGEITHVTQNIVTIDGQRVKLAPGAQIHAQNNLTIVPSEIPRDSLVEYTLDRNGDVYRVWILTPSEAARPNANSSGGYWPAEGPTGTPIRQVLPTAPSGTGQPAQQ